MMIELMTYNIMALNLVMSLLSTLEERPLMNLAPSQNILKPPLKKERTKIDETWNSLFINKICI